MQGPCLRQVGTQGCLESIQPRHGKHRGVYGGTFPRQPGDVCSVTAVDRVKESMTEDDVGELT